MARLTYRPFTKVINVPGPHDKSIKVDLKDSAGNLLNCNFVSVEASGGGTGSLIQLQASSLAATVLEEPRQTSGGPSFLGTACVGTGGVAQLVLGVGDQVNNVGLGCSGITAAEGVNLILTYGNVKVPNTLRDNERQPGS